MTDPIPVPTEQYVKDTMDMVLEGLNQMSPEMQQYLRNLSGQLAHYEDDEDKTRAIALLLLAYHESPIRFCDAMAWCLQCVVCLMNMVLVADGGAIAVEDPDDE